MKTVVCNTGPLLHLMEAGLLNLLQRAGKIYIPKIVDQELQVLSKLWRKRKIKWIIIKCLDKADSEKSKLLYKSGMFDKGEAEAIVLAKKLKTDWFLTDDTKARIFANSIGLEVHGSLGIILWAPVEGYLSYEKAKLAISNLSETSLWISQRIINESYQALEKIFSK